MRIFRNLFLYSVLFLIVLFGLLYVAANSSYVFDRAARYFAPQYDIRYDKVTGNALAGITVDGLYYKEKKLARQIKIKLNPATLLEKKITVSHLTLHGVNEQYLEYMISDLSGDKEENSSSSFPFSVRLNNVKLTMLPFSISGIRFVQADLKVESIDYAENSFDFGTLRLMAKTSLGRADIKGHYQGRDLYLSDLYIGNLNTEEIERLFLDSNSTDDEETNTSSDESPSIFIPKKLLAQNFKATVLPRSYRDIFLSMLTVDGKKVEVNIDNKTIAGEMLLALRTNAGTADIDLLAFPDLMQFRRITVNDINLTKLIDMIPSEGSGSKTAGERSVSNSGTSPKIPFIPDHINVDILEASLLPVEQSGITMDQIRLKANALKIDLPHMLVKQGELLLDAVSGIASVSHRGTIKDNQLNSHIELLPAEELFRHYDLPLRKDALKKISIDAVTNKNMVSADIAFSAPRLLEAKKDGFNLDIKPSSLHLKYLFDTGELTGDLESNISTPYTENSVVDIQFGNKNDFGFKGKIFTEKVRGIDPRLSSLFKGLTVDFDGDLHDIVATIDSKMIKGRVTLKDLATGTAHLESKKELALGELIKLPEALRDSRAKLLIDMPIDTNMTLPLHARAKILSNIVNMDANVTYDKRIGLTATANVPSVSLLKNFDKNIQFDAISPLKMDATFKGDDIKANIHAKKLKVAADYNMKTGATKGNVDLAGTTLGVSGSSSKILSINAGSRSIQTLLKAVNSIYKVDIPDVSGDINLQAKVKDLASLSLILHSKEIMLGKDIKNATKLSNLSIKAKGDAKGMILENYTVETQGVKFYADKPSKLEFKGDRILLSPVWVNDMLKATGDYDLKKKKGRIAAWASELKIDHEMADVVAALGLETKINGDRVSVSGKIHLKSGNIKYDLNTKSFAADSDIIILQRQHKKSNYFENNIAMQLTLDSSKPLLYKKKDIDIALLPDLAIKKRHGGSLKVYGKVSLLPGGFYIFQGKRFVLKKSSISFRGKPTAPILNISIVYHHTGTTIHVKVSGTASDPSLSFSSDPHMSREEILSFIMFDTGSGGNENKAGDITNLVAGSLVKSLFANMGLKLDHLVLTGSGFEVGKKISDKITVIYDQEEKSSIKVRIDNTKYIETDISFGTNSRSADIFYKREF